MTLSVLVVDDDPLVRSGLRLVLSADAAIAVVGEAANGSEAVARTQELGPDVVLMDLQMPVMDGLAATREIRRRPGGPAVLVLTTFDVDDRVLDALEAGASGYLLKDVAPEQIARSVHLAAAGESVFSAAVTERLVRRAALGERHRAEAASHRLAELTAREREVAVAVAEGRSNAAIASAMFMSEATVKTHVSRILTKLGADNRVQIALAVFEARREEG